MNIFDKLNVDIEIIVMGSLCFSLLLFILVIVNLVRTSKLKKKYKKFMSGSDAKSLETQFLTRLAEIDELKLDNKKLNVKLERLGETLLYAYQKIGIVKYDAFKEMGGKLSFAIALLNSNNDGFIINSMHSSREGCYTYIKEIIKGESYVVLAEEEKLALDEAIKSRDYMN